MEQLTLGQYIRRRVRIVGDRKLASDKQKGLLHELDQQAQASELPPLGSIDEPQWEAALARRETTA